MNREYKYKEVFGTIFYSEIPRMKQVKGIDGSALTFLNLDKSAMLVDLVTGLATPKEVMGELQFAFVTFLLGENYESFEQWKSLLTLICYCQSALV